MASRRKLGPKQGYKPAREPVGYSPKVRSRKAPKAYHRRNPYYAAKLREEKEKQWLDNH